MWVNLESRYFAFVCLIVWVISNAEHSNLFYYNYSQSNANIKINVEKKYRCSMWKVEFHFMAGIYLIIFCVYNELTLYMIFTAFSGMVQTMSPRQGRRQGVCLGGGGGMSRYCCARPTILRQTWKSPPPPPPVALALGNLKTMIYGPWLLRHGPCMVLWLPWAHNLKPCLE